MSICCLMVVRDHTQQDKLRRQPSSSTPRRLLPISPYCLCPCHLRILCPPAPVPHPRPSCPLPFPSLSFPADHGLLLGDRVAQGGCHSVGVFGTSARSLEFGRQRTRGLRRRLTGADQVQCSVTWAILLTGKHSLACLFKIISGTGRLVPLHTLPPRCLHTLNGVGACSLVSWASMLFSIALCRPSLPRRAAPAVP